MKVFILFFYLLSAIIATSCNEQASIITNDDNLPFIEDITDSLLQKDVPNNQSGEESLVYKVENETLHILLMNFPISCDCTKTEIDLKISDNQIIIKPIEADGGFANCFNITNFGFSIKNLINLQTYSIKIEKTNYNFDVKIEEGNSGTILKELPERNKAFEQVKLLINNNSSLDSIDIYASKTPIPASTDIKLLDQTITSPNTESWLFFIDEMPKQNWGHPCQYIFIDKSSTPQIHKKNIYPVNPSIEDLDLINTSIVSKRYNITHAKNTTTFSRNSRNSSYNNNCHAVIISGGGSQSSNHIRYWNDCSYIYSTLINLYNYNPNNIHVLISDGKDPNIDNSSNSSSPLDLDGDGIEDIDYAATKSNVEMVLGQLATQLSSDDYLFIYTIDHGGLNPTRNESYLVLWNNEILYASEFYNKVKNINTKTTNIVMGQCNSGGFIEYFENETNTCISTACAKNEYSYAMADLLHDEFVYYWTRSHYPMYSSIADNNQNGCISSLESHTYATELDTRYETPQYYAPENLSQNLTLSGINYGNIFDGYCVFNYATGNKYPFYADEPNHEPEFGVACGDKIDITITVPDIHENTFSWSIVENNSYTSIFVPNDTQAHLEVRNQSPIGQRIRVKVEANIPEDNYYLAQYLNFYITSNYRIARSENNVLSIENVNTEDASTTYTLNSSVSTFTYQILDEGTNNVRMSGSYPKNQKLNLDISQLASGTYTLVIKENGETKANQRLTI